MEWSAWTNGKPTQTGSGLGLQVPLADRAKHFDRRWQDVVLELETNEGVIEVRANVRKRSFWSPTCGELITAQIGLWLLAQRLVPWPERERPKFKVSALGDGRFRVSKLRRLR